MNPTPTGLLDIPMAILMAGLIGQLWVDAQRIHPYGLRLQFFLPR